jgi:hypothetical protein
MNTTTMTMTKGVDNHDKEDPPRGKIRDEGQGKEEELVSAEDVHRTAIQVENGNAAFLLMADAMVATATLLSSSTASGALLSLIARTMTIIPGLSLPQQHPGR